MTYTLLGDCNVLSRKELHSSFCAASQKGTPVLYRRPPAPALHGLLASLLLEELSLELLEASTEGLELGHSS